jgi:hypothetical protein
MGSCLPGRRSDHQPPQTPCRLTEVGDPLVGRVQPSLLDLFESCFEGLQALVHTSEKHARHYELTFAEPELLGALPRLVRPLAARLAAVHAVAATVVPRTESLAAPLAEVLNTSRSRLGPGSARPWYRRTLTGGFFSRVLCGCACRMICPRRRRLAARIDGVHVGHVGHVGRQDTREA